MPLPGDLSTVPYGEPSWLTKGFKSPYYKESHRQLQQGMHRFHTINRMLTYAFFLAMRKFVDEVLYDDAQSCEESGKRSSVAVRKAMA